MCLRTQYLSRVMRQYTVEHVETPIIIRFFASESLHSSENCVRVWERGRER